MTCWNATWFYPVKCTLGVEIVQLVWLLTGWPLIAAHVRTGSGAWSFCYTPITWAFDHAKAITWWTWPLPFASDEGKNIWNYTLCTYIPLHSRNSYVYFSTGPFYCSLLYLLHFHCSLCINRRTEEKVAWSASWIMSFRCSDMYAIFVSYKETLGSKCFYEF